MSFDAEKSLQERVDWVKKVLADTGAKGIIYGNSGGKDCTLVGAIAHLATDNVLGVIMPCQSSRNYGSDRDDAILAGKCFGIEQIEVDLTKVKEDFVDAIDTEIDKNAVSEKTVHDAYMNINPRLRMSVLYALGQAKGYLVAGTGNLCERTMGYFTKWGDGACDFNPIADLTVEEVYALLRYLKAPASIIEKAPSAGLYEGQTDEQELGISYQTISDYLRGKEVTENEKMRIERAKRVTEHKRRLPLQFGE